jgi:hypothetical protein
VKAQIDHEHRGNCPHGACCLRCTTYRELFHEAADLLEAQMREPTQAGLFDEVAG